MNQLELAQALKVTQAAVSKYLSGRVPKDAILQRLAELFGTSTVYLLDGVTPHESAFAHTGIRLKEWDKLTPEQRKKYAQRKIELQREFLESLRALEHKPNFLMLFYEAARQLNTGTLFTLYSIIIKNQSDIPATVSLRCLMQLEELAGERSHSEPASMSLETFVQMISALAKQ